MEINKCSRCKKNLNEELFIKNNKLFKTCTSCRKYTYNKWISYKIDGSFYCKHNYDKNLCKICTNPHKITIKNWICNSKKSDKKYNRYDADRFIDKCFLKELVKDYPNCYYCEIELQYFDNNDTLATIERLNNSKGHIKSNCVIACRKCNLSRERE